MKTFYRTTSQVLMGNVTAETVYRHLSLILIHGKRSIKQVLKLSYRRRSPTVSHLQLNDLSRC